MIDLQKEAEEYANNYFDMHSNHYKGVIEGYIGCATTSKYVQAEKLKAQIEVLNKIGKKGSNPIDIEEEIFFLQQQLNQL